MPTLKWQLKEENTRKQIQSHG